MTDSKTGKRMACTLRLAAVQVLLADPDTIPDDLEESLYSYRGQFAGQDARR